MGENVQDVHQISKMSNWNCCNTDLVSKNSMVWAVE